jgi:TonB family protein
MEQYKKQRSINGKRCILHLKGVKMNDTIVLINNDRYGAPELKKLSQGFTLKGLIFAVTIHIALIAVYMLAAYVNQSKAKDIPHNPRTPVIITEFDMTPPPIDEEVTPPVKNEQVTEKVKDLSSLQPEPVRKKDADDVVLKTQDELNNVNTTTSGTGDTVILADNNGRIKVDDSQVSDKIDKVIKDPVIDIYTVSNVDVVPECTNLQQIKSNIQYPEIAKEAGIEGKVTVKVLVGTDGDVIKIGSLSGPEIFHQEVREKAKDLKFTPGLQSNKPVKVWITVPFNFKLN